MKYYTSKNKIDWLLIALYLILTLIGLVSIYSCEYDGSVNFNNYTKNHIMRMVISYCSLVILMNINFRFYYSISYYLYIASIISLVLVLLLGKEVSGSKSWIEIYNVHIQPSEFAKVITLLAIARFLNDSLSKHSISKNMVFLICILILLIPLLLTILQGDTGSSIVYLSLIIPLYRIGLAKKFLIISFTIVILFILVILTKNHLEYLIISIGGLGIFLIVWKKELWKILLTTLSAIILVFLFKFILSDILKEHQRKRIEIFLDSNSDPSGYGYQVTQSKIAIGSGGFSGKGFLKGTQTQLDFIPEQSTDFIFCNIAEEHGWIGSMLFIILFLILILRLIESGDFQKWDFGKIYSYGIASILFFHFIINIGMVIGFLPVIGIPLPFISYGGSSLWTFSIGISIFLSINSSRTDTLKRSNH